MGEMVARNMYSNLAVNKYLHTDPSCWISSTQNYGARNYKYTILYTPDDGRDGRPKHVQ